MRETIEAKVCGSTTLYGKLMRIGNHKPTAQIVLEPSGKSLTVELPDQESARQLSPALYQVVGLEGDAVWRSTDWEILEFKVTRVLPFVECDVVEAFKELSDAAGGAWDNVDVDAYLKDLRAEEEQ